MAATGTRVSRSRLQSRVSITARICSSCRSGSTFTSARPFDWRVPLGSPCTFTRFTLPPELKKKIQDELRDAPPGERAERTRRLLQKELEPQIRAAFRRRVAAGELSREEVDSLAKAVRAAPTTRERAHLLRDFILAHPNAFRLNPKVRERLKKNDDPEEDLRLIEQLQPRPKGKGAKGSKAH